MKIRELLESLPAPQGIDDEASFKQLWQSVFDPAWSNEELAFAGGVCADRPAFLFIAGYQATIRKTFGVADDYWSAVAVSEDRSSENPRPPVKEENGKLNGCKTWIASSQLVDELIVSAGSESLYRIPRDYPGLTISNKPTQSFLGDMSQGVAELTDLSVNGLEALPAAELKQFGRREPLYIYLAFCGFLFTRAGQDVTRLVDNLVEVAAGNFSATHHRELFAAVDDEMGHHFNDIDPGLLSGTPDADRKLISMYSPAIQKRAGR